MTSSRTLNANLNVNNTSTSSTTVVETKEEENQKTVVAAPSSSTTTNEGDAPTNPPSAVNPDNSAPSSSSSSSAASSSVAANPAPEKTWTENIAYVATIGKDLTIDYAIGFAAEAAWNTFTGIRLPTGWVTTGVAVAVPYVNQALINTARNLEQNATKVKLASMAFATTVVAGGGMIYSRFEGDKKLANALSVTPSDANKAYGQNLTQDLVQPLIETSAAYVAAKVLEANAPAIGNGAVVAAKAAGRGFAAAGRGIGRRASSCWQGSSNFFGKCKKRDKDANANDYKVLPGSDLENQQQPKSPGRNK